MRTISPILLLTLTACDPTGPSGDPEVDLQQFASCDAMKDHLADSFMHQYGSFEYHFGGFEDSGVAEGDSSPSAPSDYSTTNIQEAGVDEPDLVKTDGEFIYMSTSDTLRIVQSWPVEDSQEVGQVRLSGNTSDLFLHGDRMIAYSSDYIERDGGWAPVTTIDVIDVSDRTAPEVVATKQLDGRFVSARRIGGDVYTVTQPTIALPHDALEEVWDATYDSHVSISWNASAFAKANARRNLERRIRPIVEAAVDATPIDAFLPQVTHEDGTTSAMADCSDILHGAEVSSPGMTVVSHIDLDRSSIRISSDATAIMAGSATVYASQRALYVAQSSFGWWDGFTDIDTVTQLHQFTLDGENTAYTASGKVDGFLHNQFSMSEHEGLLRVATTDQNWRWGSDDENERAGNNIFVLDAEQPAMPLVGELRGLAPGERIYATRFQADRAFMVTFVQIDPLFTIDLSRPTDPQAVGELKIPGYSAYLQAIGDDHVLGVGMDGDWDGGLNGIAISLFDVSDFAKPTQQDQLTLECDYSWSEALWDHHAIMVHKDTVAIPAYGYRWGGDHGYDSQAGLLVATIDTETGLNQTGFIDHSDLAREVWGTGSGYAPQMLRSMMIEDNLFSISEAGIVVSALDNPEVPLATVPLR